jgi:UDP-N-acetylmuramyl pentapeptide phosphotransferase/UDP-N-acetylglucosamine-1-phosphate transferase
MGVYLSAFVGSLILSFILTPIFKKIAVRYDILDRPTSLKNHTVPVPYLGGGAIFLAFLLPVLLWGISKIGYSRELFSMSKHSFIFGPISFSISSWKLSFNKGFCIMHF